MTSQNGDTVFEIRIICDTTDRGPVTASLLKVFTLSSVNSRYSSDGQRLRLYATAEQRTTVEEWPMPEQAYATAPNILREIGWTARSVADKEFGVDIGREFWLRKAALLDRVALTDEAHGSYGDASDAATEAARRLMDVDEASVICDPRHYVRREYAAWAKDQ
jgi:hypothetical protein